MTSSRHRLDNATIFDVCCEIESAVDLEPNKKDTKTKVLYPPEFSDENTLRSIKQFCFPMSSNLRSENEAVQLFTFVLTDAQSLHSFGGFLWVNFFYKLLNTISCVFNNGNSNDVELLLTNAYHLDIPEPGAKLQLNACSEIGRFSERIPDSSRLPTLREDKFLLEFFNAVNEKQMIHLYASLLKERRIIFTATKLSQLSACVFSISKLFYPFNWQNLFIPILPYGLTDMLMAPMPYLIGVPKETFRGQNKTELGDVVLMDMDEKIMTSPYDDKLPLDAYNFLRTRLKFSSDVFLSDSLSRAFMQTNVLIFGNYISGFVIDSRGTYSWDRKLFVDKQRSGLRPFLSSLIGKDGVQYFEREAQAMGVRGQLDKNSVVMTTDVLQQAVSSVKENANDVIGALKEQIHSLSVRNKLNPKPRREKGEEPNTSASNKMRRPSSSVARSRSKCKHRLDPLTVDTSQKFPLRRLTIILLKVSRNLAVKKIPSFELRSATSISKEKVLSLMTYAKKG
uniref:UDENN domain-containing protein n=1 Tax=Globodera rostochiensis TaxID=31243 RepID=A0A914HW55_GLORO